MLSSDADLQGFEVDEGDSDQHSLCNQFLDSEVVTESACCPPTSDDMFNCEAVSCIDETQVSYIGQDCEEIPLELGELYGSQTRRLDLSYNLISDLSKLNMQFPNLEELILDSNCIGDNVTIPFLPRLKTLTLNKNQITDIESLLDKVSSQLPALSYLSLLGNSACPNQLSCSDKDEEDYQRYRYFVLYKLPKLRFLDSRAVTKEEVTEAKRIGEYTKVVRYIPDDVEGIQEATEAIEVEGPYSPLPNSERNGKHYAVFGVSKYVYYGRHSEGNRFIRNHDL